MVLSNAERQRRHRIRLKEMLASGVTAEDVRRAARIIFDQFSAETGETTTWDEWVASTRGGKGNEWVAMLPYDPAQIDEGDFGDDTELVRRVAAVVQAVLKPPVA